MVAGQKEPPSLPCHCCVAPTVLCFLALPGQTQLGNKGGPLWSIESLEPKFRKEETTKEMMGELGTLGSGLKGLKAESGGFRLNQTHRSQFTV